MLPSEDIERFHDIRNMILLVETWRDEDGQSFIHTGDETVHDLGGLGDPAQGYYAGLPGRFFAKVNHDADMQGPTFFTDAAGIQFDNRIPALATDVSNYTFAVPGGGGTARIRARRCSVSAAGRSRGSTRPGEVPESSLRPLTAR